MAKRALAVAMGITPDLAFAAGTVLLALRRFPPCPEYDVVLHHGGVRSRDLALLSSVHPCHFVPYRCPEEIRTRVPGRTLRAFSELVFAKYECFELLRRYAQVIWLDADLLIRGDTTALLERGRRGAAFAREDKPLRFNFSGDIAGFDLERPFFNTGLFVLSDRLHAWDRAREWLLDATVRHADRAVMGEQGIMNLWLQQQRIEPAALLPEYNVFRHRPGAERARIVHAVGHHKPWMDFTDAAWNADYERWLTMGGTPCPLRKTIRFMAARHPDPLRHPGELPSRAKQIAGFLIRRARVARRARFATQA